MVNNLLIQQKYNYFYNLPNSNTFFWKNYIYFCKYNTIYYALRAAIVQHNFIYRLKKLYIYIFNPQIIYFEQSVLPF